MVEGENTQSPCSCVCPGQPEMLGSMPSLTNYHYKALERDRYHVCGSCFDVICPVTAMCRCV